MDDEAWSPMPLLNRGEHDEQLPILDFQSDYQPLEGLFSLDNVTPSNDNFLDFNNVSVASHSEVLHSIQPLLSNLRSMGTPISESHIQIHTTLANMSDMQPVLHNVNNTIMELKESVNLVRIQINQLQSPPGHIGRKRPRELQPPKQTQVFDDQTIVRALCYTQVDKCYVPYLAVRDPDSENPMVVMYIRMLLCGCLVLSEQDSDGVNLLKTRRKLRSSCAKLNDQHTQNGEEKVSEITKGECKNIKLKIKESFGITHPRGHISVSTEFQKLSITTLQTILGLGTNDPAPENFYQRVKDMSLSGRVFGNWVRNHYNEEKYLQHFTSL